jgi:putative peptidoglycan lipid II flippase
LASFLAEGSVSFLYYADRLVQFPLGVFSLALATAMLPAMSRQIALGNHDEFRDMFQKTISMQFYITLPAMVGLVVMAEPLVALLFQRGNFGLESTVQTAKALWAYALGLPFLSGASLAARVFYSLKDTKTPAKVAAISLGLGVIMAIILLFPLKHVGLALASSLASVINFTWLALILRKKGNLKLFLFVKDAAQSCLLALFMGAVLWPLYFHDYFAPLSAALKVVLGLAIGPLVFFGLSMAIKSQNLAPLKSLKSKIMKKFKKS